jgi:hypothetical protein
MAGAKKGISYKISYDALESRISDKLETGRRFSTEKERSEAVEGVMDEAKSVFESGIADYLDSSIDDGIHNYFLKNKRPY